MSNVPNLNKLNSHDYVNNTTYLEKNNTYKVVNFYKNTNKTVVDIIKELLSNKVKAM